MSAATERLIEFLRADSAWTEVDGDDFEEQEMEDGMKFESSLEIRETEPAGWQSHYFAQLDEAGDWQDPEPMQDDDEEED